MSELFGNIGKGHISVTLHAKDDTRFGVIKGVKSAQIYLNVGFCIASESAAAFRSLAEAATKCAEAVQPPCDDEGGVEHGGWVMPVDMPYLGTRNYCEAHRRFNKRGEFAEPIAATSADTPEASARLYRIVRDSATDTLHLSTGNGAICGERSGSVQAETSDPLEATTCWNCRDQFKQRIGTTLGWPNSCLGECDDGEGPITHGGPIKTVIVSPGTPREHRVRMCQNYIDYNNKTGLPVAELDSADTPEAGTLKCDFAHDRHTDVECSGDPMRYRHAWRNERVLCAAAAAWLGQEWARADAEPEGDEAQRNKCDYACHDMGPRYPTCSGDVHKYGNRLLCSNAARANGYIDPATVEPVAAATLTICLDSATDTRHIYSDRGADGTLCGRRAGSAVYGLHDGTLREVTCDECRREWKGAEGGGDEGKPVCDFGHGDITVPVCSGDIALYDTSNPRSSSEVKRCWLCAGGRHWLESQYDITVQRAPFSSRAS